MAVAIVKTLLALLTVGALLDSIGAGAYVAPALVPFLWLAARDSGWAMWVFWTLLALPCAWLLGLVLFYPANHYERAGQGAAVMVLVLFVITRRRGQAKA